MLRHTAGKIVRLPYVDNTSLGVADSQALGFAVRGRISCQKKKRHQLNNVLQELSDSEPVHLHYPASFYAGVEFPRTAAAFLQKSLLRQMFFRGMPESVSAFLFRDNTYGNIFDEQLIHQLLQCCKDSVVAELDISHQNELQMVRPVALRIDIKLGRRYLPARGTMPRCESCSILENVPLLFLLRT